MMILNVPMEESNHQGIIILRCIQGNSDVCHDISFPLPKCKVMLSLVLPI